MRRGLTQAELAERSDLKPATPGSGQQSADGLPIAAALRDRLARHSTHFDVPIWLDMCARLI